MIPFRPTLCTACPDHLLAGLRRGAVAAACLVLTAAWTTNVQAQGAVRGRHYPLDQATAPGVAGRWSGVQRGFVPVMQPVRVELPGSEGSVAVYTGSQGESSALNSASVVALRVGSIYRLKLSDLPEYPGVELYPTVELIDRLHPPRGREIEFAIPVALTAEEIALAIEGRLVTKVIYLEQPDRATPSRGSNAARSRIAAPRENPIALADQAGRPMAIVRIGGRAPDAGAVDSGFFGTGAPVLIPDENATTREGVSE